MVEMSAWSQSDPYDMKRLLREAAQVAGRWGSVWVPEVPSDNPAFYEFWTLGVQVEKDWQERQRQILCDPREG